MAKSKVYERGQANVSFNMTPMIDCTFQLILFFMLSTQMASADYVQMKIPKPEESIAKQYKEPTMIINVVPYGESEIKDNPDNEGRVKQYRIGTVAFKPDQVGELARMIESERLRVPEESRPAWVVEIRADQNVEYAAIAPVLEQLQQAKQEKVRITAMPKMADE